MKYLLFFGFFYLFLATPALALTISFSNLPASINLNQETEIDVSLNCQSCSDSYLRGVFFSSGSTNYFGLTQNNNSDWIDTSEDKIKYFKVAADQVVNDIWTGKLKIKPDSGDGNYQFKVIRYTAGGSGTPSSETSVTIVAPTPTITNTPQPTATPTDTPSPSNTPTNTPAPTPTKAPTPTTKPTPKPTLKPTLVPTPTAEEPTPTITPAVLAAVTSPTKTKKQFPLLAIAIIGLGCIGLAVSATLVWHAKT